MQVVLVLVKLVSIVSVLSDLGVQFGEEFGERIGYRERRRGHRSVGMRMQHELHKLLRAMEREKKEGSVLTLHASAARRGIMVYRQAGPFCKREEIPRKEI